MLNSQMNPESIQEIPVPDTMTLAEFLENDVEGYEYVKGELVPMPPATMIHGEINMTDIYQSYVHATNGIASARVAL